MNWVDAFGWFTAIAGIAAGMPQLVKLIRGRTSAGLSLLMYQGFLAASIGWGAHGFITGRMNVIVPNLVGIATNLYALWLIQDDRRLAARGVYPLGVVAGLALIAIDLSFGPVAFGWSVLLPLLIGALGQFKDLLFDLDIRGVSLPFLAAGAVMQLLWLVWSIPTREVSVMICAGVLLFTALLNLGWMLLRLSGRIRVFGAHGKPVPVAPLVEAGEPAEV